jgi:hypothetical protein
MANTGTHRPPVELQLVGGEQTKADNLAGSMQ